MSLPIYQPSGKFNPLVFVVVPGMGLVGGLVGGWLYQFLIDLIPFIVMGALLTVVFGLGIGALVGYGLKLGKCRNKGLAIGLGACVGVFGLASSYFWAYQTVKSDIESDAELAAEGFTITFSDYIDARVEFGWQVTGRSGSSGGGTNWSGGMVYFIWLVEAVIIVGAAAVAPIIFASRPYCEGCDCWAESTVLGNIHGIDVNSIKAANAGGDWHGLVAPATDANSAVWAEYTLYSCPADDEPLHLTVKLKWEQMNGKRKETKSEDLVEHGLIEPELVGVLQQSIAQPPAPRPSGPARPAAPRPAAGPARTAPGRPPAGGPRPPLKRPPPRKP